MRYTFSTEPVAEFYRRKFHSITNSDGRLVAYSEKVFEIPEEVTLHNGGNTLIFENAILVRGEIRGGTILGGEIRGGEIRGGTILGGTIWGGEILGGEILGGTIWGGEIRGGEILGGTIWGGEIRGGKIWGGEILGGTILGGIIRGGVIRGGVITVSLLQIQGTRHFMYATPSETGETIELGIGCKIHTLKWWEENYKDVGESEGYSDSEIEEYATYIAIFRARYFPEKGV